MHPRIDKGSRSSLDAAAQDVGTLWMLQRSDVTARCALLNSRAGWELRAIVGAETILTERCDRTEDAFAVADLWKRRLIDQGWRQIVPGTNR
jgi:hypothetical protein